MIVRGVHRAVCSSLKVSFKPQKLARPTFGARVFANTSQLFKDDAKRTIINQMQRQPRAADEIPGTKPETARKPGPAFSETTRKDPLALGDKSNKEQRKADWAILKEMVQYLWPKDNLGTK